FAEIAQKGAAVFWEGFCQICRLIQVVLFLVNNLLGSKSGIDELKTLFDLYQQGALTAEEFKDMKQHLLRSLRSTPSGC
ncbi:SHOCT domain-containing protein, partial [Simplicispira metamorpha]|uniref:SHOCT domain-containing protein n=2 Tax=Simplicispira metamorpha TaxID=80881 RepID=UPI001044E45F